MVFNRHNEWLVKNKFDSENVFILPYLRNQTDFAAPCRPWRCGTREGMPSRTVDFGKGGEYRIPVLNYQYFELIFIHQNFYVRRTNIEVLPKL